MLRWLGYGGDARCLSSNIVNSHHYVLMAMEDDVDIDDDGDGFGDDVVVEDDANVRCLSSWLTW